MSGSDVLQNVLARLHKVRPSGDGYLSLCPAHDDHRHSLSIADGDTGVILNCHAGCRTDDVVAAISLTMRDLFYESAPTGSTSSPAIAAEYEYRDENGKLLYVVERRIPKDFRQRRPDGNGGWIWNLKGVESLPYRLPELLAADLNEPVFVCYSADTEILTTRGWVPFPELEKFDIVAQYDIATEEISFVIPSAHQQFAYKGEMINFSSEWCDLLVTPDHRQPVLLPRCKPKVMRAEEVPANRHLPTAGRYEGCGGPGADTARLLVAWLADGVNCARGANVSWNLKKQRKKERLRELLQACNVLWEEQNYPSTPGWTNFVVSRASIDSVLRWAPEKRYPLDALTWSFESRSAILNEIRYWDGDSVAARNARFFTSCSQSAQIISAIAPLTGWHSNIRTDDRRDSRPTSQVAFVVNLNKRNNRAFSQQPGRVPYVGKVYCCSVTTGFLVVRRNGKVVISGNCEGEKDVDNLRALGLIATCNSGGAGKWKRSLSTYLTGRHVVILPDNDDAGREHATIVAKALDGLASSIRTIELPGLPAKGDVSDWLASGHSAEELRELLSPVVSVLEDRFVCAADCEEPAPQRWVIDGWIPEGFVTTLFAHGGSSKSFLSQYMAMCVSLGLKVFDHDVVKGAVLFLDGELDCDSWLRRGYMLARGLRLDRIPRGLTYRHISRSLMDASTRKEITSFIAAEKPALTIVDSFTACLPGEDTNSLDDVTGRLKILSELGTVLVIDHAAKGADMTTASTAIGSVAKMMFSRSALQIASSESGGSVLQHKKSNFGPLADPVAYSLNIGGGMAFFDQIGYTDERLEGVEKALPAPKRIMAAFRGGQFPAGASTKDIADVLELNERNVRNKLNMLKAKGELLHDGRIWRLPQIPDRAPVQTAFTPYKDDVA